MAHPLSDLAIPGENSGEIKEYISAVPRLQGSERVPDQQSECPLEPLEQLICGFMDTDGFVATPEPSPPPIDNPMVQPHTEPAIATEQQQQKQQQRQQGSVGSGRGEVANKTLPDDRSCIGQPCISNGKEESQQDRDHNPRLSNNDHNSSLPAQPAASASNAVSATAEQPNTAQGPTLPTVPEQATAALETAEQHSHAGHGSDVVMANGFETHGVDKTAEAQTNPSSQTATSSQKSMQPRLDTACNGSPKAQTSKGSPSQITRQGSAVAVVAHNSQEEVKQDASKYPRLAPIPHLLPGKDSASQNSQQVSVTAGQGKSVSVKLENEVASVDSKPAVVTSMQQPAVQSIAQQSNVQQSTSGSEGKHPAAVERYMRLLKEKKIRPLTPGAQPATITPLYPIAVTGQQSSSAQQANSGKSNPSTNTAPAQTNTANVQLPASWQGMPLINQNQSFAPAPQPVRTLFSRGKGGSHKAGSSQHARKHRQHQHGSENGAADVGRRQPAKLSEAERLQRARDVMVMLGRQVPSDSTPSQSPKPEGSSQPQISSQDANGNDGNTSGGSTQQRHITRIGQLSGSFPSASRRSHTAGMLYGAGKSLLGEKRRKREALNVDTSNIVDKDHRSMRQSRNSPAPIYSPDAFHKQRSSKHGDKERGHSSGRRGRQPLSVEGGDPASAETYIPLFQRAKAQLALMRREEHLVQTYRADGWKGRSRERVQLTNDLKRALASMQRRADSIRECVRACEEGRGLKCIPDEYFDEEGELDANYIFCAVCDVDDCDEENDIILCDGNCRRAFHCRCVKPNIGPKELEADEWLCPACDYKNAILGEINADFDTDYTIDTPWQEVLATDPNKPSNQALLTAAWLHLDGHVSTQHAEHDAVDADGKATAKKGRNVPRAARNRTAPAVTDQNGRDPLLDLLDEDESDEDYVEGMSDEETKRKKRSEPGSDSGSGSDDEGETGSNSDNDSDAGSGSNSGSGSDLGSDLSDEDLGEDDEGEEGDKSENGSEGEGPQQETSQEQDDQEQPQPKRTRIQLKPIKTSRQRNDEGEDSPMVVTRKRRARKEVDYVKLHQELFGHAAEEGNGEENGGTKRRKRGRGKQPIDHHSSEDEDYDPELGSP